MVLDSARQISLRSNTITNFSFCIFDFIQGELMKIVLLSPQLRIYLSFLGLL
jgi:hypothetical protein